VGVAAAAVSAIIVAEVLAFSSKWNTGVTAATVSVTTPMSMTGAVVGVGAASSTVVASVVEFLTPSAVGIGAAVVVGAVIIPPYTVMTLTDTPTDTLVLFDAPTNSLALSDTPVDSITLTEA
jgi:hypothetical protein